MFQQNSRSRITLNGHLSDPFPLQRGCRQGDPMSPYIFILCSEFLALAFKNEPNFHCIKVLHKEQRLSQYADDTSIFMQASSANLDMGLQILEWFYLKSGLKINFSKTKVIRLGNIRETDRRFGRENNLDWVSTFTALGIQYDVLDMTNITNLNIQDKLNSMRSIIKSWSCRNITPIGKIAVLKSLVLSKITHIIQSLPSPSEELIQIIEKMAYNFIWGTKRHEVSKQTLCKNIKDGGLTMLNIREFEKSLKITWLRKLLTTSPEWEEFALHFKVDRLLYTDTNYHKIIVTTISNPFWRDVASAYKEWYAKFKKVTTISTVYLPIWGNPDFNLPFNRTLFENKIYYVQDMFDENGTPYTQDTLEGIIGKKLFFTQYLAFWNAIPRNKVLELRNVQKETNLNKLPVIEWLTKDKKGGVNIRKIWNLSNKNDPPIGQLRWEEKLDNPEGMDWEFSYMLPLRCKLNANIRYFQYQILNRSLITNRKLCQFQILDNENCDHCGEVETICHLLLECNRVQILWTKISKWLSSRTGKKIDLSIENILLGNNNLNYITNYVIIVTKNEIYRRKWKNNIPSLHDIQYILKKYMAVEIYIGTTNEMLEKVLGKWSPIYNDLRRL